MLSLLRAKKIISNDVAIVGRAIITERVIQKISLNQGSKPILKQRYLSKTSAITKLEELYEEQKKSRILR